MRHGHATDCFLCLRGAYFGFELPLMTIQCGAFERTLRRRALGTLDLPYNI